MEAALKHAPTHTARTVAPVDQVLRWLLMESLAHVMFSSKHLSIKSYIHKMIHKLQTKNGSFEF